MQKSGTIKHAYPYNVMIHLCNIRSKLYDSLELYNQINLMKIPKDNYTFRYKHNSNILINKLKGIYCGR